MSARYNGTDEEERPGKATEIASAEERTQVLYAFNSTAVPRRQGLLIHQLFEEQVDRTPWAAAAICQGETVSYGEVNSRANQLARYLREVGVTPDGRVGICMERSIDLVVGVLGILKAGGAYVPLDLSYPAARLAYMLRDSAPRVVLTLERLQRSLPWSDARIIAVDEVRGDIARCESRNLADGEVGVKSNHLAYVIYTSGSTGGPKGAMNEHGAVVNWLLWMQEQYRLECADRVLLKTPFSFDVSVREFFLPLISGASLVVARPEGHRDPGYLRNLIEETRVTILHFVPSMLRAFLEEHGAGRCSSIRHVICSGEELTRSLQDRCLELLPQARLSNLYGPTECAVEVTAWECTRDETGGRVPIGRPIANTQIYILDRRGEPVPVGVAGEIHIAGVQVGRGYLNRAELTAERFVADPFSADPKGRMYKSGDLGRWRADGTIEYLGRNDEQVKIRGFRIELGEIEAQLVRHADVKEAVVLAREDEPGEKRLVGYVIAEEAGRVPSAEVLREHLKGVLPEYMVPSAFVALQSFPLTPNGKLDRRGLPAPDESAYTRREYEEPRGEVEEILAGIWQQLLKAQRVGRNDNFFELGGDSLLAVQIAARLRRSGMTANVQQLCLSPGLAEMAKAISCGTDLHRDTPPNMIPRGCTRITPEMLPLVELSQEDIEHVAASVPGGASNVQDIYPLIPLQDGLLFHYLLNDKRGDVYVISKVLSFTSKALLDRFISELQRTVDRHDALRTAVLWEGLPRPVQVVYRRAKVPVEQISLQSECGRMEAIWAKVSSVGSKLELREAPLLRLTIVQDLDGVRWYALLQIHHLVCDEQALGELFFEVEAGMDDRAHELPQPVAYRKHVAEVMAFTRRKNPKPYFCRKLEDIAEPCAPFGLLDVRGDGSQIGEASSSLGSELGRRLRREARKCSVSPAALFHAAWALVVARTTDRDDVVYGTVLIGRLEEYGGADRIIGMFVNTLPVRIDLRNASAKMLVQRTFQELMELLPFEQASLVDALHSSGMSGSAPLFTTLLNYKHGRVCSSIGQSIVGGIAVSGVTQRTNYPITASVDDSGAEFSLTVQTDRRVDAGRVLGYLNVAIKSLVDALEYSPGRIALALEVLPESERREILKGFNPVRQVRQEQLLQEIFEGQVRLHPQAIAVSCEGQSLTYGELNARANQLAWHLRERGVGAERLVGICMERSLEMVVGLLGILKAGGAYVPLDPGYPAERLAYMLADAAPSVVLTQEQLKGRLPQSAAEVVVIDTDWGMIGSRPTRDPALRPQGLSSESLAYVIYTSGSTGKPKGVMVEHRNVARLFAATENWFGFGEQDVWTLFHSFAFDFSVWELWGALLYGGRVVIVPHLTARSPQEFYRLLCREGVTVLNQTPSAFAQLARAQEEIPDLKHTLRAVIFGGEALEFRTLLSWMQRNGTEQPQLINMYGITETTVHVTYRQLSREEIESERGSLIGRPIPDLKAYLLDRNGQPVPIGVSGEIYVGGAGVARGYLNRAELTAERFVADPFSADPKGRMYKSGDLGRWRADGTIEYLGRNDEQVKIRGFRIELGEIEAQLVRHADVKEAVVLAREDEPGEKRLVGYVIAEEAGRVPSAEVLREHLKGVLPEYMVPSAFVALQSFPLTPNGKLDRRGLPAPDESAYTRREYEEPRGEVEEILAGIWQQLLKVQRVGRNDNFFELGGHSLLIVQMMERLRRVGLAVEVRRVFDSPRLSDLASALIRRTEEIEVPPNLIPQGCKRITPQMLPLIELEQEHIDRIAQMVPGGAENIQDIYPLAPLQEGMLFHHLLDQHGTDAYVLPILLTVSSRERVDDLIEAVEAEIEQHDVLRTAVLWEEVPKPLQVVQRKVTLRVDEVRLDPDLKAMAQIEGWMSGAHARLDLREAPLVRLRVAQDPEGDRWYVLLQFHHVICDHITTEMLTEELVARLKKQSLSVSDPVPYRNRVAQLVTHAGARDSAAFFRGKLGDVVESTAPFAILEVHGDGSQVQEAERAVELQLSGRIRAQARKLGVSAATLFHAAWALVVAATSMRNDVVFGTMLLGRLQGGQGVQRALGLFINTLPLRLRLSGQSAKGLVEQTQGELIELLAHDHASLATAQRCSSIGGSTPLFTSLLNYRHSVPNAEAEFDSAPGFKTLELHDRTNYPIAMAVDDLGAGFSLVGQADRGIDPHRLLEYLNTAVSSLVEALERSPGTSALALEVLPDSERRQLLEVFNPTREDQPEQLLQELFEAQVRLQPQAIALAYEEESLTYSELDTQANQLARHLRECGVGPDDRVGIYMERGLDMVVGLLGILKAGGAYVPLDPCYPAQRVAFMLADAAPAAILTQGRLKGRLPSCSAMVIALDEEWNRICIHASTGLSPREIGLRPDHLAYVLYTSGSTGEPKGVMVEHRNVLALWAGLQRIHEEVGSVRHVALNAPINFDASVQQVTQLLSGRVVRVIPEAARRDPEKLCKIIQRHEVECVDCTPSQLKSWLAAGLLRPELKLRLILVGGEAIEPELWCQLLELSEPKVYNVYGPTECTVDVTSARLSEEWSQPHIGRPMLNRRIYILGSERQLQPIGVSGEIYVGGAGVARGYLNRAELTAERFVADPFSADPKGRMYKSGDLGRWRADGTIEYLGRNDEQVKIRGFRIELGEIEAQLVRHADVKEAVVLAREDEPGEKRLVGYVIAEEAGRVPSAEVLREHLKGVLPEYMVPSAFVALQSFPLTPNGKLDRRGLPAPDESAYTSREYEEPRGEVEEILAGIWQQLLKVQRVGRNDNFFELGGHSLSATQAIVRIRSALCTDISMRALFKHPTLGAFASQVAELYQGREDRAISSNQGHFARSLERVARLSDEEVLRLTKELQSGVAS